MVFSVVCIEHFLLQTWIQVCANPDPMSLVAYSIAIGCRMEQCHWLEKMSIFLSYQLDFPNPFLFPIYIHSISSYLNRKIFKSQIIRNNKGWVIHKSYSDGIGVVHSNNAMASTWNWLDFLYMGIRSSLSKEVWFLGK